MESEENNSLPPEVVQDVREALSLLDRLGAKISFFALAGRFAKERQRRLWSLRARREKPADEPSFLSIRKSEAILREVEDRSGRAKDGLGMTITLALFCGLRRTEIARVSWSDVNLANGTLRVPAADGARVRVVLLEPTAVEWIDYWRHWVSARRYGREPKHLIVQEPDALRGWLAEARLPEGVPATPAPFLALLRSTYATMHLCARRNADETASNLGHARAGDAIVFHYEGLVTQGIAKEFWSIHPRRRFAPTDVPLPPQRARKLAAMAEWRKERAKRDREKFRGEVASLSVEAVKSILDIVLHHPGRVETAAGLRLALGLFAGFKTWQIHLAQWEDFDLRNRTAVRRTMKSPNAPKVKARFRGDSEVVTLHPAALAWISFWKDWMEANGAETKTGPVVPKFTHFRAWRAAYLDPMKLVPAARPGQDVLANTFFAMRYPDLQEPHPADPVRTDGVSEAETFWEIRPPEGFVPPDARHAVERKPSRRPPGRPRGSRRVRSEAMPIPDVRKIMRTALRFPGAVAASPGAYLTLGFFAGLHTSEIAKLRWSDVDMDGCALLIREPEGHRDESGPFRLELHPVAWHWLRLWRDWAATAGAAPDDLVVPQPWRFLRWRRQTRIKWSRKWPYDIMRITYNERRHWPSYWRIKPDADPCPADRLPGRGWRRKKKEPTNEPDDRRSTAALALAFLPRSGPLLLAPPPGPAQVGEGAGTGAGPSPANGLAQEIACGDAPRPPDGPTPLGRPPESKPECAPGAGGEGV